MTLPEVIEHWNHDLKMNKHSMWERQVILETIKTLRKSMLVQARYCKHCGEKIE